MTLAEIDAALLRTDAVLLRHAAARVEEARAELERAQAVCDDWTEACGIKVWREGHSLDRQKLRDRRLAKRNLAYALQRLDDLRRMNARLLLTVSPAGSA
jgi:hypothetical protein